MFNREVQSWRCEKVQNNRQQEERIRQDYFLSVMWLFTSISFYDLGSTFLCLSRLASTQVSPHVEVILQKLLLSLVSAAHVISPALVGHQLPVGLHHHRVEVLHPLHHVSGHCVARPQRQRVADQTLKMMWFRGHLQDCCLEENIRDAGKLPLPVSRNMRHNTSRCRDIAWHSVTWAWPNLPLVVCTLSCR